MRPTPQREDLHAPIASSVSPTPKADLKRRRFLLAMGAGSAATVAVATQAIAAPLAPSAAAAAPVAQQGYRETEHVRDYYATTRRL